MRYKLPLLAIDGQLHASETLSFPKCHVSLAIDKAPVLDPIRSLFVRMATQANFLYNFTVVHHSPYVRCRVRAKNFSTAMCILRWNMFWWPFTCPKLNGPRKPKHEWRIVMRWDPAGVHFDGVFYERQYRWCHFPLSQDKFLWLKNPVDGVSLCF